MFYNILFLVSQQLYLSFQNYCDSSGLLVSRAFIQVPKCSLLGQIRERRRNCARLIRETSERPVNKELEDARPLIKELIVNCTRVDVVETS